MDEKPSDALLEDLQGSLKSIGRSILWWFEIEGDCDTVTLPLADHDMLVLKDGRFVIGDGSTPNKDLQRMRFCNHGTIDLTKASVDLRDRVLATLTTLADVRALLDIRADNTAMRVLTDAIELLSDSMAQIEPK